MNLIQVLKPGIPRRYLLFVAAIVWTFAGGMLLTRGILMLKDIHGYIWLRVLLSGIGGIVFYYFMFSKISMKHSHRIVNLKPDKPCFFSFFNVRSYIMMSVMMTSGIMLRRTGIVPPSYLTEVYITMGIPLFLSSLRFYYYGINYKTLLSKKIEIS